MVYYLIIFNVRFCLIVFFVQLRLCNQRLLRSLCSQRRSSTVAKRQTRRLSFFTQKWLNSACAIKDCFAHFACAQFATAVGYGFALSAEALLRRHGLTHLREQECSQKCVALICSLFLSPVSGCRQGSSPSRTPSHPIGRSFSRRASRCRSILASLLFTGIPPYP